MIQLQRKTTEKERFSQKESVASVNGFTPKGRPRSPQPILRAQKYFDEQTEQCDTHNLPYFGVSSSLGASLEVCRDGNCEMSGEGPTDGELPSCRLLAPSVPEPSPTGSIAPSRWGSVSNGGNVPDVRGGWPRSCNGSSN